MDLKGKKIVIVGVGLLGSEFARACADAGADLVLADKDAARGEKLAGELGARFFPVDIADPGSVAALANATGRVDGVVNAAYPKSAHFGKPFETGEIEHMLEDLSLHIGACLSIARSFAPKMSGGGSLVFLASIYGFAAPRPEIYEGTEMIGIPPEYAAAKGGIIALARNLSTRFGKNNIRVNAVSPGGIADGQPRSFVEQYVKHLAIGSSLLSPSDISGTIVFLLSDASKQITGQNIVVDGGWTL